ncbi:MAG: Ig domain-containing protein [Velocimicrobium sp.]
MIRTIKIGMFSIFICAIMLCPSVSARAAQLDTNLLVNPGGESVGNSGLLQSNGWNGANQGYSYDTVLSVNPHSGGYFMGFITTAAPSTGTYSCYQDIDISSQSAAISTDTIIFQLSGYLYAKGGNIAEISLQELDASDNVLNTAIYDQQVTASAWTLTTLSGAVVSDAKKLRVTITGTHTYLGLAVFDDLSVVLSTNEDKPPVIAQVENQTTLSGETMEPLNFAVTDPDSNFDSLTISAVSSNTTLIPNSNISASLSTNNASISMSSVNGQTGSAVITVSVSDGTKTTTMSFEVTVHPNVIMDANLVTNGTGESLSGWTDLESRFTYGTSFGIYNLPSGMSTYYIYQDIDISKYADMIDANFLTFTSSCDATGSGTMTLYGYNAAGTQLWQNTNGTKAIPAGTRVIRISIGGPAGCSLDNVSFIINSAGLPKSTTIEDQSILNSSSTGDLAFTIGYATDSVALTASSSNSSVVPDSNITLSGDNYHRTIKIAPQSNVSGSAIITISLNGSALTSFNLVSVVSVNGITISTDSQKMVLGNPINLSATVTPDTATNQNVTWSSSDSSVATVDSNGTVVAHKLGTAEITVTAADGHFTAKCTITVEVPISVLAIAGADVPETGKIPTSTITDTEQYTAVISWSPNDSLFLPDTSYTATITLTPKEGYTLTGVTANSFTVNGATTVENAKDSGVITAVFPKTQSSIIKVTNITDVPITMSVGDALTLVGSVEPNNATNQIILWSLKDAGTTGAVVQNGVLNTTASGTVIVTATVKNGLSESNDYTHDFEITVTSAPVNTQKVTINKLSISGVSIPQTGDTPTSAITETTQYTGVISWSPNDSIFLPNTSYTATVTLLPKPGYTLIGVTANSFIITGATTVKNTKDSGVITVVFPETQSTFIKVTNITGVSSTVSAGEALSLVGSIVPTSSTNQSILWSLKDAGTTGAVIQNDVLKTTAAGTVIVTATVKNGLSESSDYTQNFGITVTSAPVDTTSLISQIATAGAELKKVEDYTAASLDMLKQAIATAQATVDNPESSQEEVNAQLVALQGALDTLEEIPVKITGIAFDRTDISLAKGKSVTLTATITPDNAINKSISWSSSNTSVATVNANGKISANGYEITYATNKKFTSNQNTVTLTKRSKTFKDLIKGKTYYVKVRAYTTDSAGNKVYGKYSKVRKIKLNK